MNTRGFTMVELLIVSGIAFSLWGGLALMTTDAGNRVWSRADTQMTTMSSAQIALNRLTEDLRAASLAAPVTCQPGDISFTRSSDAAAMRYQLNAAAGTLTRTEAGTSRVVAGNLSALTFPTCSNGLVQVALTARVAPANRIPATYTLNSSVMIRNPSHDARDLASGTTAGSCSSAATCCCRCSCSTRTP